MTNTTIPAPTTTLVQGLDARLAAFLLPDTLGATDDALKAVQGRTASRPMLLAVEDELTRRGIAYASRLAPTAG